MAFIASPPAFFWDPGAYQRIHKPRRSQLATARAHRERDRQERHQHAPPTPRSERLAGRWDVAGVSRCMCRACCADRVWRARTVIRR